MKGISLYIPAFQNKIEFDNEFNFDRIIISDNGGSTVDRSEKVEYIHQENNLGRVGNWNYCVKHFINSNEEWMKWQFSGDKVSSDAKDKLLDAITKFPEAKLIVAEYDIISGEQRVPWRIFNETRLIHPNESMLLAAQRGNWFGSPIGHCIHKDALQNGFDFGFLPWVADMHFCLTIAERYPVLYLAEKVGEFHMDSRKYYQAQANSLTSFLEEGLIRQLAAQKYRSITNDDAGFSVLNEWIERDTETKIVQRRINRSQSVNDLMHILNPLVAANVLS